jgi:hypothetical protein
VLHVKRLYIPDFPIEEKWRAKSETNLGAMEGDEQSGLEPGAKTGCESEQQVTSSCPPPGLDPHDKPLTNHGDLIEFVEETMNRLRQGPFDLRATNALAGLAGILLKALDKCPAHTSAGAIPQLYARRLYLPEWRREAIEKIRREGRDINGTGIARE